MTTGMFLAAVAELSSRGSSWEAERTWKTPISHDRWYCGDRVLFLASTRHAGQKQWGPLHISFRPASDRAMPMPSRWQEPRCDNGHTVRMEACGDCEFQQTFFRSRFHSFPGASPRSQEIDDAKAGRRNWHLGANASADANDFNGLARNSSPSIICGSMTRVRLGPRDDKKCNGWLYCAIWRLVTCSGHTTGTVPS